MNPYLMELRKAGPPLPSDIRMQTDVQTKGFCSRDREALIAREERIREVWKSRCEALRRREERLVYHLDSRLHVLYNEYRDIIRDAHRAEPFVMAGRRGGKWADMTRAETPFWRAEVLRKPHEVNDL